MAVEENKKNDEAEIKRLLDDGIRSLRDKSIEGIFANFNSCAFRQRARSLASGRYATACFVLFGHLCGEYFLMSSSLIPKFLPAATSCSNTSVSE